MKKWETTFISLRLNVELKKNLKALKEMNKIQDQTKFVIAAIEEKLKKDGLNNVEGEVTDAKQE